MKKIAVFTGTRAEYGLLYWLLKDIQAHPSLELQLLVSAMHLSPEFGMTYKQIESDGFEITEKVEMLLSSDSAVGTVKSMGLGVIGFADALERMKPDLMIILGDRFEALAAAQSAMILRVPIAHIHGGEITEGAYDDAIRHAITKLSLLHFTSTDTHRNRVIQLGEHPNRVFNVGAVGLDHLLRTELMSIKELSASLDFNLDKPYFLVTYHPVTAASEPVKESFLNLLQALDQFPNHQVILTYPNADEGGREIIPLLESYAAKQLERVLAITSLGQKRYLSAVKHAQAVVGNSSSGIIEVPSFNIPTINIGERQRGRMAADSVISCPPTTQAIFKALNLGLKNDFSKVTNPYGKGQACEAILREILKADLFTIKSFYDLQKEL
ncbi:MULTISPECIES: UDP-N-acetylglucosamine 2-epimerase [unclassified Psychrobacter]|uniref:UDP-N-acetylglucosamine 2-epimerase n=1 Tax=unclassified Psychrobacter TaxID=196806 RepID=UPI0025B49567|nr:MULTISPECIES: UDP-N-acetylglucosamine 2-epimerase [unclassified Psychrobacter]MDN3454372.1 UDP-N-acetylglucosamine 2-epimerase [Psychrobacter sp. APC 3350]MDN3502054.1 UDP-N-acetylglucosamine 2-epimerase [Psychrobacter sp. 5A.1]